MTSQSNPRLTPKLRFPEFRNAPGWHGKALRTIADPVTNRAENEDEHNILTLSGEHGLVLQHEYFGKQIAGTNSARYIKIQRNDFVYNDRTTKAFTYGTIKRLKNQSHGIVSPIYKCFRFKESELPGFWEWYFESGTHEAQLRSLANEGARAGRFNVSIDRFLSTEVWSPSADSLEQQTIAECLDSLDNLIGAESEKLDLLQAHKKGLMQQLFPREGEIVPRLRFPEFGSAKTWRRRKMSEVLTKVSIPVTIETEHTYREIGVRSHGKGIFHKDPVSGSVIGDKRVFQVVEDALVFNIIFAWEQAIATTSKDEEGMIASHRFPMYVPKTGDCDVRYIKYALLTPQGKRLLGVASPGGAGRNRTLGQDEFEKLGIILPDKEEQTKIAESIRTIDDLINSQVLNLEALKIHKKGLMRQLFPSPAEAEA